MRITLYQVCLFSLLAIGICACTKTDDFKKFYNGKEIVYPGRANSVEVHPGEKRIMLAWVLTDPKVVSYKIFWDNRSDSLSGTVSGPGRIERIITKLTEGTHSFKIVTYDKSGNASVSVDVVGKVYGESFQSGLLNTLVRSASSYKGNVTVEWYGVASGTVRSEIKYTDAVNVERTLITSSSETVTEMPNYKANSVFKYRTLFIPDSMAIDTFYTAYTNVTPISVLALRISTGKVYSASKRTDAVSLAKPFDGNPATFWYSTGGAFPEWLQVDLKADYDISKIVTQFHDKSINIYSYKVDISNDNISWRPLVPVGPHPGTAGQYAIFEYPVSERGRYVRITFTGNTIHWASIAEFEIWGN